MEARITHQQFFDAVFNGDIEVLQPYNPIKDESICNDPKNSFILFITIDGKKKDIEIRDGKVALLFDVAPNILDLIKLKNIEQDIAQLKSEEQEIKKQIRVKQQQLIELKVKVEL